MLLEPKENEGTKMRTQLGQYEVFKVNNNKGLNAVFLTLLFLNQPHSMVRLRITMNSVPNDWNSKRKSPSSNSSSLGYLFLLLLPLLLFLHLRKLMGYVCACVVNLSRLT